MNDTMTISREMVAIEARNITALKQKLNRPMPMFQRLFRITPMRSRPPPDPSVRSMSPVPVPQRTPAVIAA